VITAEQIKAARLLLGWSAIKLSIDSSVGLIAIQMIEMKRARPNDRTVLSLQATLEAAGVEFIEEINGEGPGVRAEGREVRLPKTAPMTLANMRANRVRAVTAVCLDCRHKIDIMVDRLDGSVFVPDVGRSMVCSACGSARVETAPAWHASRRKVWADRWRQGG
jgi:hypothetical protein